MKWYKTFCVEKAQEFKENEQHFNIGIETNHGRVVQQNL
jgi:hypothetical protein